VPFLLKPFVPDALVHVVGAAERGYAGESLEYKVRHSAGAKVMAGKRKCLFSVETTLLVTDGTGRAHHMLRIGQHALNPAPPATVARRSASNCPKLYLLRLHLPPGRPRGERLFWRLVQPGRATIFLTHSYQHLEPTQRLSVLPFR
jgi:hypothetical protein